MTHVVILFLIFEELFSIFFDSSHPNECKMVSPCGFDMPFLMMSGVELLFVCLLAICI